jgi:small subunit ribosomal protein S16
MLIIILKVHFPVAFLLHYRLFRIPQKIVLITFGNGIIVYLCTSKLVGAFQSIKIMPVKLRLARHGRKKFAFYHIVAADGRAPRDGKFIEKLGVYNPNTNPATIELDFDKSLDWLLKGAQPTETVRAILSYKGVLMKRHLLEGVRKGAFSEEEAEKRFAAWMKEKEGKIQSKIDMLAKESDEETKNRVEAETKIKEARAAEILKKQSELAEDAEKEATEEVAEGEDASAEATAEAPAEASAEAPAGETGAKTEEVKEELKEEAKAEAKEEEKAEAKEEAKEEKKEGKKDDAKEEVKEEEKAEAKDEAKEEEKDEVKEEVKEETKAEAKEEEKAEVKEEAKAEEKKEEKKAEEKKPEEEKAAEAPAAEAPATEEEKPEAAEKKEPEKEGKKAGKGSAGKKTEDKKAEGKEPA